VVLLLLDSLGLDLRGIADPQLEIKFCQQPLKPAGKSSSLHTDPHVDSSRVQVPIESFCFSFTVVQLPFIVLTSLFYQKSNLLKARVIIYAYNHHVRLLPPEPVVVKQPKFTRVEGVGIVMQSSKALERRPKIVDQCFDGLIKIVARLASFAAREPQRRR